MNPNLWPPCSSFIKELFYRSFLWYHFQEVKRKKTAIAKKEYNPQYQEAFNFKVDEDELAHTGLRITCMQHQTLLEKGKRVFSKS